MDPTKLSRADCWSLGTTIFVLCVILLATISLVLSAAPGAALGLMALCAIVAKWRGRAVILPLALHLRLGSAEWAHVGFGSDASYERVGDFEHATGARVSFIHRAPVGIPDPTRDIHLLPSDFIIVNGTRRARYTAIRRTKGCCREDREGVQRG